ncbi:MAG: hypothetical protein CMJ31_06445 [Phycisphaerae bacterium]|nr:hypothetical protein [Phycisphaerae bacterium]
MRVLGRVMMTAALLSAVVVSVGCGGPRLGEYDVVVTLDEGLRNARSVPSIPVDIVALSDVEAERLREKSMSQYFSAGDRDRQSYASSGVVKQYLITNSNRDDVMLSEKDPIWRKEWSGRDRLFILADIPGARRDADRRLELPRETDRWEDDEIVIKLREDRLEPQTLPQDPAK